MAFDGIVVKSIVSDFQNKLIGARVNKVLQPSKFEIILNLYNSANYMLDICITECVLQKFLSLILLMHWIFVCYLENI